MFIDWEKPNLKKNGNNGKKIVSSWRILTFANEFREGVIE